jgi:hypothetical protein
LSTPNAASDTRPAGCIPINHPHTVNLPTCQPFSRGRFGFRRHCLGLMTAVLAAAAGLLLPNLTVAAGAPLSLIRGDLLVGRFRTQLELNRMSGDDQRNTLIVELANRTRHDVAFFQRMNDDDLAGHGALLVFLREGKRRSDAELKAMSVDDLRNTTIVELAAQTRLPVASLQALNNRNLIMLVLGPDRSFIRGALLTGRFRTQLELNALPAGDQRNTLIVELANRTRHNTAHYQSLNDADLGGIGALLVFLREGHRRTDAELKSMGADDIRNTAIVELRIQTNRTDLGDLTNAQLARTALGLTEVPGRLDLPELQRPGTHTAVLRVNRSASIATQRRFGDVPVIGVFTGRGTNCRNGWQSGNYASGNEAAFQAITGWGQVEGNGHPDSNSDQCVSWNYQTTFDFDTSLFTAMPLTTKIQRAVLSYKEGAAPTCLTLVYTQGGYAVDALPCWTNGKAQPEAKPQGCLALRVPNEDWINHLPARRPVNVNATTFGKLGPSSWDVTQFFETRLNPQQGAVGTTGVGYMLTGTPLDVKHLDANDNTRCTSLVTDARLEVTYTVEIQPTYPVQPIK